MSLESYKKRMVDLRARLQAEKDKKKADNERYAASIRNTTSATSKAHYRKSKISAAASHDRTIESIKRSIESCKSDIARERERAKRK